MKSARWGLVRDAALATTLVLASGLWATAQDSPAEKPVESQEEQKSVNEPVVTGATENSDEKRETKQVELIKVQLDATDAKPPTKKTVVDKPVDTPAKEKVVQKPASDKPVTDKPVVKQRVTDKPSPQKPLTVRPVLKERRTTVRKTDSKPSAETFDEVRSIHLPAQLESLADGDGKGIIHVEIRRATTKNDQGPKQSSPQVEKIRLLTSDGKVHEIRLNEVPAAAWKHSAVLVPRISQKNDDTSDAGGSDGSERQKRVIIRRNVTKRDGNEEVDIEVFDVESGEPVATAIEELVARDNKQTRVSSRYIIGVSIQPLSEIVKSQLNLESGVAIDAVGENSPAAKAGLKPHDIVIQAGKRKIDDPAVLQKLVADSNGEPVTLTILRAGKQRQVTITPRRSAVVRVREEALLKDVDALMRKLQSDDIDELRLEVVRPGAVLNEIEAQELKRHTIKSDGQGKSDRGVLRLENFESRPFKIDPKLGETKTEYRVRSSARSGSETERLSKEVDVLKKQIAELQAVLKKLQQSNQK